MNALKIETVVLISNINNFLTKVSTKCFLGLKIKNFL